MQYLEEWKKSSEQKGGEPKDIAQRLLSQDTLDRISITGRDINCLIFIILCAYSVVIFGTCSLHSKDSLSEHISQDPLEKFFGCQRQRGQTNENPTCGGFLKNTIVFCVISSVAGHVQKGNCRGRKHRVDVEEENVSLPKRRRKHKWF